MCLRSFLIALLLLTNFAIVESLFINEPTCLHQVRHRSKRELATENSSQELVGLEDICAIIQSLSLPVSSSAVVYTANSYTIRISWVETNNSPLPTTSLCFSIFHAIFNHCMIWGEYWGGWLNSDGKHYSITRFVDSSSDIAVSITHTHKFSLSDSFSVIYPNSRTFSWNGPVSTSSEAGGFSETPITKAPPLKNLETDITSTSTRKVSFVLSSKRNITSTSTLTKTRTHTILHLISNRKNDSLYATIAETDTRNCYSKADGCKAFTRKSTNALKPHWTTKESSRGADSFYTRRIDTMTSMLPWSQSGIAASSSFLAMPVLPSSISVKPVTRTTSSPLLMQLRKMTGGALPLSKSVDATRMSSIKALPSLSLSKAFISAPATTSVQSISSKESFECDTKTLVIRADHHHYKIKEAAILICSAISNLTSVVAIE